MSKIFNVFNRILDVITADGDKRLRFAIENVIYVAFAVICAWGAYKLIDYVSFSIPSIETCASTETAYNALAILGIIVCICTGIYTLVAGVVTQAVLLVFSLLGSIFSSSRGKNFLSFIIALISLGACAVVGLWLFGVI